MKARSFLNVRTGRCRVILLLLLGDAVALAQVPANQPAAPKAAPRGQAAATPSPAVPTRTAPTGAVTTATEAAAAGARPFVSAPATASPQPAQTVASTPLVTPAPQPAAASQAPAATTASAPSDVTAGVSSLPTVEGRVAPTAPVVQGSAPQFAMPQLLRPRLVPLEPTEPEPPARPPKIHYPFGLQFDVMPVWQTSKGFDLFSNGDLSTRIGLSVDAEFAEIAPKTPLLVELGWSTESQGGKALFGGFAPEFVAHNFHAGLKLMHRVLPFLAPHVRLAGGATWLRADYSVSSNSVAREFENHDWLAFGMLGAGITASVPTRTAVQPGLVVEGGYLLSSSMTLKLEPKENQNALATSGASLGTLERSGPYLRFGVFIRY